MNQKTKTILIILIVTIVLIFFIQTAYKIIRSGNNINSQTDDLIEYILNISSYEAKLEVIVSSNKTENKYVIEQYYKSPNYSKQIVKEPQNIENLEIIYNGSNLEIKNTNIGLSKIYENYSYLNGNMLWFNFFVEAYNNNKYTVEENEKEIILISNIENNYKSKLCINKKTLLPTKIEVKDNNNQNKIYIEYKEIRLNSIQENNIFAFRTKDIKNEV